MTASQSRSELALNAAQVEAFAGRVNAEVRRDVAAYGAIRDPEVARDFAEVNRLNVLVFFRSLAQDRMPTAAELEGFQSAARRRLHQSVPLEAIFHSYRVGVRVMWQCLLEVAPQQDHGRLAALALEYADRVSTAAAQAYVEERQRAVQSRQDAARLLLTRVINGEALDEPALLAEAGQLGLDFASPNVVLLGTGAQGRLRPSTRSDLALAQVQNRLQAAIPGSLAILLSVGLVAVVPAESAAAGETEVRRALEETRRAEPTHRLLVGVGSPATGPGGLAASYREAVRAHALGAILHPDALLHRYGELRFFDLFKEGPQTDAFVEEVLGPILALKGERRQRLAETLDALFSAALNRKLAARRLGVHQNTLSHRIRRIEELVGASLTSGELCFRLELALRLLPLTSAAG